MSSVLHDLNPDVVVVYADRFEGFSAMIAATQMNIPSAHIEGGDITEGGALDDSVRHAMTKLAHLHYTSNSQASTVRPAQCDQGHVLLHVIVPSMQFVLLPAHVEMSQSALSGVNPLQSTEHDAPCSHFTSHGASVQVKSQSLLEQMQLSPAHSASQSAPLVQEISHGEATQVKRHTESLQVHSPLAHSPTHPLLSLHAMKHAAPPHV